MSRKIVLTIVAIAALALAATPAFAGKPGGGGGGGKPGGGSTTGGGGTISLAPLVQDANGNGRPNHGDVVTFTISTTATIEPYVNLKCYQNGALVLNGWQGYFDGALNSSRDFGLGSGGWQSGASDCVAALVMYSGKGWSQLASTSFRVDA
jgi:hypothetical protein